MARCRARSCSRAFSRATAAWLAIASAKLASRALNASKRGLVRLNTPIRRSLIMSGTHMSELITSRDGGHAPNNALTMTVPLRLHAQFMAGATMSVLTWWLEEGQPFTPHQMAGYLVQPHSS